MQSDEDDEWPDTIDFGDGTKVVVGHASTPVVESKLEMPTRQIPEDIQPNESQFVRTAANPWRKTDDASATPDPTEFPDVHASKLPPQASRQSDRRPSMHQLDRPSYGSMRTSSQDLGHDYRPRSDSLNRDGRMQQSGDARYQYDQNTFDRRWHNPPPQTREIYNSTTGRMEQIDSSQQKTARRPSHGERQPTELLHRTGNDAKRQPTHIPPSETKVPTIKVPPKMPEKEIAQPEETKANAPMDPSSQEFIEMQKNLMATAREQAIQRRKDQEAEEIARKDRARKKAAELAVLVDKEREEKLAAQRAKEEALRAKNERKILPRKSSIGANTNGPMPTEKETWQRGAKLPPAPRNDPRPTPNGHVTERLQSTATDEKAFQAENRESPSRAVWGPIGARNTPTKGESSDNGLHSPAAERVMSPPQRDQASQGWSAFDGIAKQRPQKVEGREYNVFDPADETSAPSKHSPTAQQAQSNRTSSRFFPSTSNTAQQDARRANNAASLPFKSPALPPVLDSTKHAHHDIYIGAPALQLPSQSIPMSLELNRANTRSIDKIMANIRATMRPTASARHYGRYPRDAVDTQTRSVWEVKPPKDGVTPRVRVPHTEKPLDWARKEAPTEKTSVSVPYSTALPAQPAWALPKTLETTSRMSAIAEPLVPPSPSLKLPEADSAENSPIKKRKEPSRFEQERLNKFYTTRPNGHEEQDHMSPIRIKVADGAATKIPRRFGKRVEESPTPKRAADVKRQPVNMSDVPGQASGQGFKRGFTSRVRTAPPGLEQPTILRRSGSEGTSPAVPSAQGPPGISLPVMPIT